MSIDAFKIQKALIIKPRATQPASPEAGEQIYNSTTNTMQYFDGTSWVNVTSGSGGAVNFVTNPDAEAGVTGYVVDSFAATSRPSGALTGISTGVTFTTSAIVPLAGPNSFLYTKDAVNRQGRVVYTGITITPAYFAKVLQINADYLVNSGTFVAGTSTADSDVIFYLQNVTDGTFIEPSSFKLLSNSTTISDRFSGTFQTASAATSYRLLMYVASTSALAYSLKIDNITVSPSVYVYGSPVIDFQSITPAAITGSASGTLNIGTGGSQYTVEYARSGQEIIARYVVKVGTAGAVDVVGAYVFPFPFPTAASLATYDVVGFGEITVVASANCAGRLVAKMFGGGFVLDNSDASILANGGPLFNSGNRLSVTIRYKAAGLSSSVQMSDGFDGRELTLRMTKTDTAQTLTNTVLTKVTFNNTVLSKGLTWDSANNRVVCVSAGTYAGEASLQFGNSGVITGIVRIYKNNILTHEGRANAPAGTNPQPNVPFRIDLIAGDFLEVFGIQLSGAALNIINEPSGTFFAVSKLSGSATTAASEKVRMSYAANTGQSIASGGAGTVMTHNVREWDSHGAYNPATGEITFPKPGFGKITIGALITGTGAISTMFFSVLKDNVEIRQIGRIEIPTGPVRNFSPPTQTFEVDGITGTKYKIAFFQNTGAALPLVVGTVYNYIQFSME